jgi:hypothetical protein
MGHTARKKPWNVLDCPHGFIVERMRFGERKAETLEWWVVRGFAAANETGDSCRFGRGGERIRRFDSIRGQRNVLVGVSREAEAAEE